MLGRTKPFIQNAFGCTRILQCVDLANLFGTRAQKERDVIKMVSLWNTLLESIPGIPEIAPGMVNTFFRADDLN